MKLYNGGVTIDVSEVEAPRYLRAGFKKVEDLSPAPKEAVEPAKTNEQKNAEAVKAVNSKKGKTPSAEPDKEPMKGGKA